MVRVSYDVDPDPTEPHEVTVPPQLRDLAALFGAEEG